MLHGKPSSNQTSYNYQLIFIVFQFNLSLKLHQCHVISGETGVEAQICIKVSSFGCVAVIS